MVKTYDFDNFDDFVDDVRRRKKSNPAAFTSEGYTGIWKAVLAQAIEDIANINRRVRNPYSDMKYGLEGRLSYRWVIDGGSDMRMVCDLAGVCPFYVQRVVRRVFADVGNYLDGEKAAMPKKQSHIVQRVVRCNGYN